MRLVGSYFSKLIHTPYGFELGEIEQIKIAQRASIVEAWRKCIELASAKVEAGKSNYLPNVRQRLERLVDKYISTPSLVRNKIAHGQWAHALNRENTNLNNELTAQISNLDVVYLDILREAFTGVSEIVEAMIESPNKAFQRDYWTILTKIESHLAATERYTLADKIARLKSKASRPR